MNTKDIRTLIAFDQWANRRTLAATMALPPEEFSRDLHVSFGSVQGTLSHILAGEWVWLRRWRGDAPSQDPSSTAFPDAAALETGWDALNQEMAKFVAGLSDELLDARQEVRGQQYALAELMQHVVNHSTYHRGQVASLLRQLGHVPPGTDFRLFLSEGR
jgi:uncharacterized damage-inducible protein DinB